MTPAEVAAQLFACQSRSDAQRIADGLKGASLKAVIDHLGIATRGDVATRRSYLVEYTTGRRADSDAITRAGLYRR